MTPAEPARSRRGRRPGGSDTREAILGAARTEFAERGYDGASLRGIARAAGVDPALVHHYFDGKEDLFGQAVSLPGQLVQVRDHLLEAPRERLGETLVQAVVTTWDSPEVREWLVTTLRSGLVSESGARPIREFLATVVLGRLVVATGVADPERRAALVLSHMLGVAILRFVVPHPAIAQATPAELAELIGPTIQRYLVDD